MKTYHVLNLGAGVQSTTLYLMSLAGEEPEHIPRFDHAVFADTQEEPDEVYRHLEWLKSLGGPPILVRSYGKLGDDLVRGHHDIVRGADAKHRPNQVIATCFNIPTFLSKADGSVGMVRRKCTQRYKVRVIEQAIRRDILGLPPGHPAPKDGRVHQYYGLSFDEPRRIIKVKANAKPWYEPHFPLFDMEMSRGNCLSWLRDSFPTRTVPRSACVFCPYRSNAEWRQLRDQDPVGWARACEVDEAVRSPGAACANDFQGVQYMHRSCKPLSQAPIDTPESRGEQHLFGFAQECEGMCGI